MSLLLRRFVVGTPLSLALLAAASVVACASTGSEPPAKAAPTPPPGAETAAVVESQSGTITDEETAEVDEQVRIVLRQGDVLADADGLPVTGLGLAVTDGNGLLAFTGALDDEGTIDSFVWRDGALIWRASDVKGPGPGGLSPLMGSGNEGQFVFQTMVRGKDALWSQEGLLMTRGQVAPGMGEGSEILLSRASTMTPDGTAHWVSEFQDAPGAKGKGRVLYRSPGASPEAIEIVLRSDQEVGGQPIARPYGLDFNYQVSDNGEHLIQVLVLATGSPTNDDAVYLDGEIALREGEAIDQEESWDRFGRVAINDQGDYLAVVTTDAPNVKDLVVVYNGEVALREGKSLDGVSLAAQAQVLAVTLDNDGRAAHLWSVGGFGSEYLFFACDAANLADSVLVLKTGQPLQEKDGNRVVIKKFSDVGHGPALSLGPGSFLYAEVSLGDKSLPPDTGPLESIVGLALPECPPPADAAGGAEIAGTAQP